MVLRVLLAVLIAGMGCVGHAAAVEVDQVVEVAPVWSGHPVSFCLLTRAPYQFVAFYGADRQMTVGRRLLSGTDWEFTRLPEHVVWDTHNYITMTIDDDDFLHLSGNMHVVPLVYFRTTAPLDPSTFERVPSMVGREEKRTTYPQFMRGPGKELLFTYRDGSSGAGNQIYNVYDHKSRTWSRLLDTPLVDGEGKMNAYFNGPRSGPDGYYHLCWVWRDHGGCETNHDLSYARSRDLRHWEDSRGEAVMLPITLATAEVVDPVPPKGGIINGNARLGFDPEGRVVITYHKYDEDGNTQVYNARLESEGWRIYQSSEYNERWDFSGGGSIVFEMRVSAIESDSAGQVFQNTWRLKGGTERWRLDPGTLARVEKMPPPKPSRPASMGQVESSFPGMQANFSNDIGRSDKPGTNYVLRWETLSAHRDRPREKPWPEATSLRVYRIAR